MVPRLVLLVLVACGPSGKPTGTTNDPVEVCERVADVCRFEKSKLGVCTQARSGSGFADVHRRTSLRRVPLATRLALEMAAHEESERRALEGELYLLEEAWKQAEEIAAIADDMFLPRSVDAELARLRAGRGEPRTER